MARTKTLAYLSLGSNVGDRMAYLRRAHAAFSEQGISILRTSAVYETEPLFAQDGATWFLNQALEIKTSLAPDALLAAIRTIESDLGRKRTHAHAGPRTMDIDILLYGDLVIDLPHLRIPHPGLKARRCILTPLADILPAFAEVLRHCGDVHKVVLF